MPARTVSRSALRLAALLMVLGLLPASAAAGTRTWIDGTGQWDVSGNWSPNGQPQAGDDVYLTQSDAIDRTVTYYNTTNPTAVLNTLRIDATATGTVTLDMPNTHSLKAFTAYIGYSGKGAMIVRSGGQASGFTGYLGYNSGSTGAATVTGAGSKWTNSLYLYAGYSGNGTLNVEAGGQVSDNNGYLGYNSGSTGAATVTGTGSTWNNSNALYVGRNGSGTLTVADGGLVTTGTLYASRSSLLGNGTITATQGAVLDTDLVFDAAHGTTQTLVFGTGGTLNLTVTSSGDLGAGYNGTGTLGIADGVTVKTTAGYLGYNSGSTGKATVTGAGSTWANSGYLYVGYNGKGALAVGDGGLVSTGTLYASLSDLSGNGNVTVTQGAVIDADLVFDSTHGTTQTLPFGTGGTLSLTVASTGILGVGHTRTGTLRIADAVVVTSASGYVGYYAGSTGTATVTGAGSTWTNSHELCVGQYGTGTLNILDGGRVSNTDGDLGVWRGSSGTARVDGSGSTWKNSVDLMVGFEGTGTLKILDGGSVSNTDGYLGVWSGSGGEATVDGTGSTWTTAGELYVGYEGTGTLKVLNGGSASSASGYVGMYIGSGSTATVHGAGSAWTNSQNLYIGYVSTGALTVQNGGAVSNTVGFLGRYSAATGTATVKGAGSKWTNSGTLYVGYDGSGTLKVSDGGRVTAKSVSVNSKSAVRLHVSGDDMLVLGDSSTTGSVTNNGTITHYADSFLAADTYTPISELGGRTMRWTGSGSCKAVGGIWNDAAKTFTVASATALPAGSTDTLGTGERLLFTDPGSGSQVGASFGSITGSPTFSAAPMSQGELAALVVMPGFEGLVLSAWDFDTTFSGGDDVLLSFAIGPGAQDPGVWRCADGVWTPYAADLLTYDSGGVLSFTVTDFSGYAVTAIPEPASAALLLAGLAGVLLRFRRAAATPAAVVR